MITEEQYQEAVKVVIQYRIDLKEKAKELMQKAQSISKEIEVYEPNILLHELDISVRLYNALRSHFRLKHSIHEPIASDLSIVSQSEFIKLRAIGKKSLEELKLIAEKVGVCLLP